MMAGFSPALIAYRLLTRLIEPLAPRLLDARAKQGKEDPARVDERLGLTRAQRPDGPLIWLHGVSVGEALSILPLAERLRRDRPDATLLVTTGTLTSARVLADRLPPGVIHQFAPVDGPAAVAAFLDHWRPALGVLVESELWPNLLLQAKRRGVALALVSARITQKTADGWRRFPGLARRLTGAFNRVWPQDQASADRLSAMGARIDGQVNLKLSGDPLPYDKAAFADLSARIGDRPVVVAASTHEGEETALVQALADLPAAPVLILVPRHPERGALIAERLRQAGRDVIRRSLNAPISDRDRLYLADTLGELGLFLRLADVVIMGGSFAPALGLPVVGGHNPLEPARLSKPVISGPDATNWAGVAELLEGAGGMVRVAAPSDLPAVVGALLADPAAARDMGERARRAAAEAASGLDRLTPALTALLPPPERRRRP